MSTEMKLGSQESLTFIIQCVLLLQFPPILLLMSETCGLYSPDIEVWSGFVDEHVTHWTEFAAFEVTNDAGTTNCKEIN